MNGSTSHSGGVTCYDQVGQDGSVRVRGESVTAHAPELGTVWRVGSTDRSPLRSCNLQRITKSYVKRVGQRTLNFQFALRFRENSSCKRTLSSDSRLNPPTRCDVVSPLSFQRATGTVIGSGYTAQVECAKRLLTRIRDARG